MRRFLAAALILTAGCSGFATPTPEDFRRLRLGAVRDSEPRADATRYRVHMSVDSKWLAGEFDGVVMAHEGWSPLARAQLFGDLGPKVFDLLARPDRIAGYFAQTREGVDCLLPAEARPHPLLFLGVSLVEDFGAISEDRVLGIREVPDGWWLNLKPLVPGLVSEALWSRDGQTIERRFRWMYGVTWRQRWSSPEECSITASGLVIRIRVLGSDALPQRPPRAFEITMPGDVRIVEGTRK